MNYRVVFDASQNGAQLAIWLLIPVLALLPGLVGWALRNPDDAQSDMKGRFFMVISAVGLVFSIVLAAGHYGEYYRARRALGTGNYRVSEGPVTEFVPMPPGGHATESFKVGNDSFSYGSGWGSIVFNSEWNRGYIHNGSEVRISHKDGDILRVEVK